MTYQMKPFVCHICGAPADVRDPDCCMACFVVSLTLTQPHVVAELAAVDPAFADLLATLDIPNRSLEYATPS